MQTDAAGRVLIVDDDQRVRRLVRHVFEGEGFEVVEAGSAEAGLAVIDRQAVDAVVLDQRLGGTSGLEMLARLRHDPATAGIPVVVLTGDEGTDVRTSLDAGANDHLAKPFDPLELVARVRAHLREQRRWARVLEDGLRERIRATRLLAELATLPTFEAIATSACTLIAAQPGVLGAAIVRFVGDAAVVLSQAGHTPRLGPAGGAIGSEEARWLHRLAGSGPASEPLAAYDLGRPTLLATCPIDGDGSSFDALVLYCDTGLAGRPSQAVGAAVDFAVILSAVSTGKPRGDDAGRASLVGVIARREFEPHFQPIVELSTEATVGYEALTRFADGESPASRFATATRLGLSHDLELAAAAAAVAAGTRLPRDRWLAVNVSPSLILSGRLGGLFGGAARPVILEVTEQEPIDDYRAVRTAVAAVRGVAGLSVDDAGSGFASLQHVLALRPQFVKLDRTWVRELASDPARQALIAGLVYFAGQTGSTLIAEGVELERDRDELARLGVLLAQGFLFARPAPAERYSQPA